MFVPLAGVIDFFPQIGSLDDDDRRLRSLIRAGMTSMLCHRGRGFLSLFPPRQDGPQDGSEKVLMQATVGQSFACVEAEGALAALSLSMGKSKCGRAVRGKSSRSD